jgi:hypothetical protein
MKILRENWEDDIEEHHLLKLLSAVDLKRL